MDDLRAHFYATVGGLLDHAAVGRLRVRLELADGGAVEGVPSTAPEPADEELDDTGYPRHTKVGGETVELQQVRRATVMYPGPHAQA